MNFRSSLIYPFRWLFSSRTPIYLYQTSSKCNTNQRVYTRDDSKRTKKWELHFNSQLDRLIELFASPEKILIRKPHKSVLSNPETTVEVENPEDLVQQSGPASSEMEDEETTELRNALLLLIQPGTGIAMKQLANDMVHHIQKDSRAMNAIRGELVKILWENDWKLDPSMVVSTKIDTTVVGRTIAKGIQFSTIQTREDSIPKTCENTYSWILQDESPTQDGITTRNTFPKWLDDDSQKAYWITGKPGSGKSTIMKMILNQEYLKDWLSRSLGTLRFLLVKYYAWISGDTLQKSIEGLKKTIIFQALEQYPDLAPALTPRRWAFCQVLRSTSDLPLWDKWEVEESFEALLSSCGGTIKLVLFIDGLDEFKTPPFEIIKCIRYMMTRCSHGFKACVASRPWPEFQDEFSDGPMLQMHLLTQNDMKIFVNKTLTINKGFVEQSQLHPDVAEKLLTDIVEKANGVFLWVSIVVQHLSSGFSGGESIFQARKTLEALPSDISSLYDAIWADICPDNLPDASYMIQVLEAFEGPLPWLTLWLIEELRFATIDEIVLPETERKILAAQRSLKRKLAARTKCILEINEGGQSSFVDFVHRTARDWAMQTKMWQLICSESSQNFDPYLYILKGEASHFSQNPQVLLQDLDFILKLLKYADQVRDISENEPEFLNYLDLVNQRFEKVLKVYKDAKWTVRKPSNDAKIQEYMSTYGKNFLELTVQFAILPYIRAVANSDPDHFSQQFFGGSLRLVRRAIYGNIRGTKTVISKTSCDRRLDTVKYLLERDVYQSSAHIWKNAIRNLKKEILEYLKSHPENSEYFSTVAVYLDEKESEFGMRSRMRSFWTKMMQ